MDTSKIREHMPVVSDGNERIATVDRIEGDSIKLTKDQMGQHHWIPVSWVTSVDQSVHLDRDGQRAMREWMATPPEGAQH